MEKQEKPFDIRCEEFRQNLIGFINNSNLPISTVYYIVQLVNKDLESAYYGSLNSQSQEKKIEIGEERDQLSAPESEENNNELS